MYLSALGVCSFFIAVRLHGSLRTTRAQGPVKTACESEQTLRIARDMRRKNTNSFLTREAAGVKA